MMLIVSGDYYDIRIGMRLEKVIYKVRFIKLLVNILAIEVEAEFIGSSHLIYRDVI